MEIEVITKEELLEFKRELLNEIRLLISPPAAKPAKPWLKNLEVRELLHISSNTVQRLRTAGKLPAKKVGGTHYYRYEDIEKLMNSDAA